MKVRIGNVEISDISSLDELEAIVRLLGDLAAPIESGVVERIVEAVPSGGTLPTGDKILLRRFVTAHPRGIETADVGMALGRKGKAIRPAALQWANRIGLTKGDDHNPFEQCRVGTQRGMRISDALIEFARELAK
jgi:hypothetical protein